MLVLHEVWVTRLRCVCEYVCVCMYVCMCMCVCVHMCDCVLFFVCGHDCVSLCGNGRMGVEAYNNVRDLGKCVCGEGGGGCVHAGVTECNFVPQ